MTAVNAGPGSQPRKLTVSERAKRSKINIAKCCFTGLLVAANWTYWCIYAPQHHPVPKLWWEAWTLGMVCCVINSFFTLLQHYESPREERDRVEACFRVLTDHVHVAFFMMLFVVYQRWDS